MIIGINVYVRNRNNNGRKKKSKDKENIFFIYFTKKTAKLFNDVLMRRKVPLSLL